MILTRIRMREGRWHGLLEGATGGMPRLGLWQDGRRLATPELTPEGGGESGRYIVAAPIPAEEIREGVLTFLIRDEDSEQTLAHFSLVAGGALEDDLRAEIALLRDELDLLKAAFRRHCAESRGPG